MKKIEWRTLRQHPAGHLHVKTRMGYSFAISFCNPNGHSHVKIRMGHTFATFLQPQRNPEREVSIFLFQLLSKNILKTITFYYVLVTFLVHRVKNTFQNRLSKQFAPLALQLGFYQPSWFVKISPIPAGSSSGLLKRNPPNWKNTNWEKNDEIFVKCPPFEPAQATAS